MITKLFKKALSKPPQILVKKIYNMLNIKISNYIQRKIDLSKNTHIEFNVSLVESSYINIKDLDISTIEKEVAKYLSMMYCEHRFDLLGSGWVKNSHDSMALGVEGYSYDMNILAPKSVSSEYEPIDWQKDYKSGFRWDSNKWYKDQKIGHKLGVDIKVPWELARFQHLPQLAIFAMVDRNLIEQNIKEFKYQVLDFVANNPPRMGVNWFCSMDVGIRAANLVVAYDMFMQLDTFGVLDDAFKQQFANTVYEHGLHIVNNLEYKESLTSNHYLSNVVGLLFISVYLNPSDEIDQWLAFALQEIIFEMQKEFYEDGGNFESSTSYHRLSGELMVYSSALILGLKEEKINALMHYKTKGWRVKPKLLSYEKQQYNIKDTKIYLPKWFIDRLYKVGRFTVDITKPSGEIPQIGDNDSGRFFRFSPNGYFITDKEAVTKYLSLKGYQKDDELFWDENILNHNTFLSAMCGLFNEDMFETNFSFEKSFIQSISKAELAVIDKSYKQEVPIDKKIKTLIYAHKFEYKSKLNFENLRLITYPDSGIYIFRADNLHLTLSITPLGQNNHGGHTHNDKLSFELWMDNQALIQDPGTYIYTPLPNRRDEFRSSMAHNIPIVKNIEQNDFHGLFGMHSALKYQIIDIDKNKLEICIEYHGVIFIRKVEILENRIVVYDSSNKELLYNNFDYYSNGYGKIEKR